MWAKRNDWVLRPFRGQGGEGGTPSDISHFGLKTCIDFAHFGLESGVVFEGTTRVYKYFPF